MPEKAIDARFPKNPLAQYMPPLAASESERTPKHAPDLSLKIGLRCNSSLYSFR